MKTTLRKIAAGLGILSLTMLLAMPAMAEESNSTSTNPNSGRVVAAKEYKGQLVVTGTLAAISGTTAPATLTVTVKKIVPNQPKKFSNIPVVASSLTVQVTDKTKIVRRYMGKSSLAELAVGDELMVTGKMGSDGSFNASLVKDNSIHITFFTNRGEITAIDATAQTFTMKRLDSKTDTVEKKVIVSANTKILKSGQPATFADLKVSDWVGVRGVIRPATGEILADWVNILPNVKVAAKDKLLKKKASLEAQLAEINKQLEALGQ